MGLPTSIETLIEGTIVESARIEFKETWDPQASLKTICAFANDIDNWGGGYLVIGVREDTAGYRTVVGVPTDKVDLWLKDMVNKCKLIQPDYMPIVDVAEYEGKALIVVWAPGGSVRPYSSPKSMGKKSERIYWIRKMASTLSPSEAERRDLYNLANNVPFDDRVHHGAEVDDLNITLIKGYLREVGSSLYAEADTMDFVELCQRMDIVQGPKEYLKPKNVGLLFFASEPERFFPYARIDIVELPEGEGGSRLEEHIFAGPLHHQMQDALRYLRNNVIEERVRKYPDRAESDRYFNYPYDAIGEALANAVYHKGYDVREPIEVRVLPDRIELLSFPGADRSISAEGLRQFRAVSRRYRNRRVGEYLKELGLTEGRNTGIRKMLAALRNNGSPDPIFETDEERLYFLVTIFARQDEKEQFGNASGDFAHEGSVASRGYGSEGSLSTEKDGDAPTCRRVGAGERRELLLRMFEEEPSSSILQASKRLGVSVATVNRDVEVLKQEGRLIREGSSKSGCWRVL